MARKGANSPAMDLLSGGTNVRILADGFCLKERAITEGLLPGVKVSDVDTLVDLLASDGVKAVWH